MRVRFIQGCLILCAWILTAAPGSGLACGIRWGKPHSRFDGVDDQGHVLYTEKIGDLDLGAGLKLPIRILFKSSWNNNSPYLGNGWILPLLESNFVQVDEKSFQMRQPGGWYRNFRRDTKDSPLLKSGKWLAEIKGDMITAWAECGDKLVFKQGRIQSLTIGDRTFTFLYSGARVTEIREGGTTRLSVLWNDDKTIATGLHFSGKTIELEQGEKPRVQDVGGRNLISGIDRSLSQVTTGPGMSQSYEFAADDKLRPTLQVKDRKFTWDPSSGHVISDGKWTYSVKPGAKPSSNAAIARNSSEGQREFWHEDKANGQETIESSGGIRTVTYRFSKGLLAGRMRKQEKFQDGKLIDFKSWNYDEKGTLFREIHNKEIITWVYDDKGRLSKKVNDRNETLYEITYDDQNRKMSEEVPGSRKQFTYLANGTTREEVFGGKSGRRLLSRREIDKSGKLVLFTGKDGFEYRRHYNEQGQTMAIFQEGRLMTRFVYDQYGRRLQEIQYGNDGATVRALRELVSDPSKSDQAPQYKWRLPDKIDPATKDRLKQEAQAFSKKILSSL